MTRYRFAALAFFLMIKADPAYCELKPLEILVVPIDAKSVKMRMPLDKGRTYYLRTCGTAMINAKSHLDAAFRFSGCGSESPGVQICAEGAPKVPSGLRVSDQANPDDFYWGEPKPSINTYLALVTGIGRPLEFSYRTCDQPAQSGRFVVELFDQPVSIAGCDPGRLASNGKQARCNPQPHPPTPTKGPPPGSL